MKTTLFYFTVDLPEFGMALTWIGGGLRRSKRDGHVWLTTPKGEPVLEVPRFQVHASNREAVAQRIVQERRLAKAPMN